LKSLDIEECDVGCSALVT